MIAATFWAVFFIVLAVAAALGALATAAKNLLDDDGDAVFWVPFAVVLVIVVAFAAAGAAAFSKLAGWS